MGRGEPGRAKPWREVRKEEGGEEKEGKEGREGEGGEGQGGAGEGRQSTEHTCAFAQHTWADGGCGVWAGESRRWVPQASESRSAPLGPGESLLVQGGPGH